MKFTFPSREFDEAVAAVCHGSVSDEQSRALNELLRGNPAARDEYILRLELHSRLASEPDLFGAAKANAMEFLPMEVGMGVPRNAVPLQPAQSTWNQKLAWTIALAASVALAVVGTWGLWHQTGRAGATSKAVAMLNRTVDAKWSREAEIPKLGAPLEPGWLRLESGLVQVVFYSGARVAFEGPGELQLISSWEAAFKSGRLTAEVPPEARGFRVSTSEMRVTDLGTSFGLNVKAGRTELHVFKGSVEMRPAEGAGVQSLHEGEGAIMEKTLPTRMVASDPGAFATIFDLQAKSVLAQALRYDSWRAASGRLNHDPSLLLHLEFGSPAGSHWQLINTSTRKAAVADATIVGGQWTEGRWPEKRALDFQSVNDRVRVNVPGEFEALTFATWVRVQGLDRTLNSLFMSDGFDPGTVHWLVRSDGVLSLTIKGPGKGNSENVSSPRVLTLDQLGQWVHLAVVLDGKSNRVSHYVNGALISEKKVSLGPPFRVGASELGNWNAKDFAGEDPSLIRNLSGAMDEFCLFSRALDADQILTLYSQGKPQADQ